MRELDGYNTLINNAGFGRFSPLVEQNLEVFNEILRTNVVGAMLMARGSARHFIGRGSGNIVNVASTAALSGFAGGSAYVASPWPA